MASIESVLKSNLCLGCGACAVAYPDSPVDMVVSEEGYLRPRVHRALSETEVQVFDQVCPGQSLSHPTRGAHFHPLWGPLVDVGTGYSAAADVRHRGSSGGGLSALAIHLLESGAVQGVLHIAASPDKPFENIPKVSTNRDEIIAGAGSRYAPASPLTGVRACLERNGVFAFIGKPCDVAALRALQRQDHRLEEKFPYVMSFMCAGTPSFKGTEAVIERMGLNPKAVVRFRYRGNGWPGMARAETANGEVGEMDYDASWGQILNRHLQFRCKICPDGTGEFADVTCADAWYGDERGYPSFEESAGRSLILARTARGRAMVAEAVRDGALVVEPLDVADIRRMQPYQVARKAALLARLAGLALALRRRPVYRRLGLWGAAREISLKSQVKNALGTWMRAVGVR